MNPTIDFKLTIILTPEQFNANRELMLLWFKGQLPSVISKDKIELNYSADIQVGLNKVNGVELALETLKIPSARFEYTELIHAGNAIDLWLSKVKELKQLIENKSQELSNTTDVRLSS